MVECLPMAWETGVQSQVESYQKLKKWYLIPTCLTLNIIRYVSRVKNNPGKGVVPSPTPQCSSYWKGSHHQLYFTSIRRCNLRCVCVCVCVYIYIYIYIYTHAHTHQITLAQWAGAAEDTDCISAKTLPMSVLGMTLNNLMVKLQLWGMWIISLLPSLRGPLWPRVVAPDCVLSDCLTFKLCTYAKLNCLK